MTAGSGLALALGGVGWTALACLPVLSWLEAEHLQPALIATTGFATLPAALWTLGTPARDIARVLRNNLPNHVFRRRDWLTFLSLAGCPLPDRGLGHALWRSAPLKAACRRLFDDTRIETAGLPLRTLLVDCASGQFVEASEGRLSELAYASTALLPALPPLRIDGRWLGDASVYHAAPLSQLLLRPRVTHVVAVACSFPPPDAYTSLVDQQLTVQTTLNKAGLKTASLIALHLLHGELVLLTPRLRRPVDPFDLEIVPEVLAAAESEFDRHREHASLLLQDA